MTPSNSARHRLIRCPDVCNRLGLPKSSLYDAINNELMTPGVKISLRSVAWPEHEVEAVLMAAMSDQPKAERQRLVRALVAARTAHVH